MSVWGNVHVLGQFLPELRPMNTVRMMKILQEAACHGPMNLRLDTSRYYSRHHSRSSCPGGVIRKMQCHKET